MLFRKLFGFKPNEKGGVLDQERALADALNTLRKPVKRKDMFEYTSHPP
jgi:hypothetical protein